MPTSTSLPAKPEYNPRWFIWTIVFLVVTGISLVSYIVLSDNGTNDVPSFSHSVHRTTATATTTTHK